MNINEVIPPELLASILDYLYADAITSIDAALSAVPPLNHHPLLDTMLVCRSWHQVINSTPSFWTFVWIGPGTATQDGEGGWLKGILGRSGQLALSVMIAVERIGAADHFHAVREALHNHFQRVGTLSLVRMNKQRPKVPSAEVQQLVEHPFPSLKRLKVDDFYVFLDDPAQLLRFQTTIDSPQLQELSCHFNFVIPQSPSQLTSISLTSLDPFTHSSLIPNSIELPLLLDLRLTRCHPATLLLAFITPSLRRLFIDEDASSTSTTPQFRPYPNLEELQWTDRGPDPAFSALLPLCPNLIRYSNYQVGDENNVQFKHIDTPATILSLLPGELGDNNGSRASPWPKLEEILLDVGKCDDISPLMDAMPSLKRVRILQNFMTRSDEEARLRETGLLPSLRKMVDIAFWLDPWGSNLGIHFERTEEV